MLIIFSKYFDTSNANGRNIFLYKNRFYTYYIYINSNNNFHKSNYYYFG